MIGRAKRNALFLGQVLALAGWAVFGSGSGANARAPAADAYQLTVGDVVSFDFLDDTLPSEQLTVSSDGQVNLPLIGGFKVEGLTVSEALGAIRRAFVERRFFIDPQISFAIVNFRPIYVLGDVRSPGSYPFQPTMNVEQAVALAGGQSTGTGTNEDRIVMQTRLRGDIDESSVEIARAAIAAARVRAQLDGRLEIAADDIPEKARPIVTDALRATLIPTEQKILEVEARGYKTRFGQLTAAVTEVNGALENLAQLVENKKVAIASAREDLERSRALYKRGIKTITELSGIERETTAQESQLLEIYNQMSSTRRELGDLQRDLSDTTDTRTKTALSELQGHYADIERLLALRDATEKQIVLLSSLSAEEASQDSTIVFSYRVRSKVDGRTVTHDVDIFDDIAPGDTVLVSIDPASRARGATLASAAVGRLP
ncbi:polysaccharide biosynthesis/export family protein [Aureimonas sp. AU22]|uniref:polysaccharide biosynthesis/export family protein n=1 Tax=Aureimonas sp. AU22 TaxID=1638162 RepID=UPI00078331F1|nr:polysaccharide biosynthesis/export family protein [Aureimonas sp. AU22]